MVTSEHEWNEALGARPFDLLRDSGARLEDLIQEASVVRPGGSSLGQRRLDVPPVLDVDPRADELVAQPGVPDSRGPHVYAASTGSEVECGSDNRNASLCHAGT